MSTELLLSVITVTYNDRLALESTLGSCRAQIGDKSDCEFIVIDGGSSDGTDELMLDFADIISAHVSETDRGIYDAMNKGLGLARSRYVMYLNAGDIWADDSALQAVRSALTARSPHWLIGGAVSLDGGHRQRRIDNIPHSWFRHAYGLQPHCHQSTFVRRDLMNTVSGFSEQYDFAGDFDLILRIGLIARPEYLDRITIIYAGGGVSAINGGRIPELQHRVRSDRMYLGTVAKAMDASYMRYQLFRRWIHPFISALKRLATTER